MIKELCSLLVVVVCEQLERLKSNPHVDIIQDVLDDEDDVTHSGDYAGSNRLLGVQVLPIQVGDL